MSLFKRENVKGYCVACRETVDMHNLEEVEMRNKKKAWKGTCSECGKPLYKIKAESQEGMW